MCSFGLLLLWYTDLHSHSSGRIHPPKIMRLNWKGGKQFNHCILERLRTIHICMYVGSYAAGIQPKLIFRCSVAADTPSHKSHRGRFIKGAHTVPGRRLFEQQGSSLQADMVLSKLLPCPGYSYCECDPCYLPGNPQLKVSAPLISTWIKLQLIRKASIYSFIRRRQKWCSAHLVLSWFSDAMDVSI